MFSLPSPYLSHDIPTQALNPDDYLQSGMNQLHQPADANWFIRFFHLHCFVHMFRIFRAPDARKVFSRPRFQLFRPVRKLFSSRNSSNSLFKNLIFTYKEEVVAILLITIVFACLNLLVPYLIRSFMAFMQDHDGKQSKKHGITVTYFTLQFIVLQTCRLIFGQHAKRLSNQLAIKVESTLSKRLIDKSLRMAKECTDRLPQSEVFQLENVDLKLIFILFKNLYLSVQAPFTILAAVGMMFMESSTYGFIAIYWFLIAFLIQRQLDQRMTHCNFTKLNLIDRRSKINYQMISKIKSAKISGCQNLIVQRNNDLFIEQNHDHHLFYFYSTLYDISLLMLPIIVVVSISLFDINEPNPITIQEVYVMLSLLQMCYNPMKSCRVISISFHDGLHSLKRIAHYFNFPDQIPSLLIKRIEDQNNENKVMVSISKNTVSTYAHSSYDFWLEIHYAIELKKGDRLAIIGRRGQGCTSFMHMLVGNMKKVKGSVSIGGKIAYLPDKNFFSSSTVRENIAFYNKNLTDSEILETYEYISSTKAPEGWLDLDMSDLSIFAADQLQQISLSRILCSNADIYILDNPFNNLLEETCIRVEKKLRQKQKEGKTVICALKNIDNSENQDLIVIINEGRTEQFGRYKNLVLREDSQIGKFFKSAEKEKQLQNERQRAIIEQFQKKVHRAISCNRILEKLADINEKQEILRSLKEQKLKKLKPLQKLLSKKQQQAKLDKTSILKKSYKMFLWQFLTAAKFSQSILIYIIIISAQILHIFIHFFIGHEYEEHQHNNLGSFKNLMIIEVILTLGLAGIIYLQGEVSSHLAIIKGNTLYRQALTSLTSRSISWFQQEFLIKIADKFNHDYEQIFIAEHNVLAIYKNIVILIVTIFFVSSNKQTVIVAILFIGIIYYSIMIFLRECESKVVMHYYDYKYQFVRVFEESLRGAETIKIFDVKREFTEKAKEKYTNLAAYKLSQSYISYGEELLCDFVSIFLLGLGLEYGIQQKFHGKGTAVIATTIFLLMNLSQVLKNIVKLTVNLQSYFLLNLEPFLSMINANSSQQNQKDSHQEHPKSLASTYQESKHKNQKFDIVFKNFFSEEGLTNQNISQTQSNALTLQIPQGSKVLILQKNAQIRDQLVYALTKNLMKLHGPSTESSTIKIGGQKINDISSQQIHEIVGVISNDNFFFHGTLKDNLSWKVRNFDEKIADGLIKDIELNKDLQNYDDLGLDVMIEAVESNVNSQLNRKIALLRILITKPKIIIIKDIPSFLGMNSIVQIIQRYMEGCTIIKISSKIQSGFDMDRFILLQNLKMKEDGLRMELKENLFSPLGQMYRQSNVQGYIYSNMAIVSPKKKPMAKSPSMNKQNHH